jgi:hypothetical protein
VVGCDGCKGGLFGCEGGVGRLGRLQRSRRSVATVAKLGLGGCDNCVGLLHRPMVFLSTSFFSEHICEVMVIHKGKTMKQVYLSPDIISFEIFWGIGTAENQQVFSRYSCEMVTRSQHCLSCAFLDLSF